MRRLLVMFAVAAAMAMTAILFLPSVPINCDWFPWAIECWFAA